MFELTEADDGIHFQNRFGDTRIRLLAWRESEQTVRQLVVASEKVLRRLDTFRTGRTQQIETFGKNRRGAARNHCLAKGNGMCELGFEMDVGINEAGNRIKPLAVKHLPDLQHLLVRIECDDALVIDENGTLVDGLAMHIEDVEVLQKKIGLAPAFQNIKYRTHLVIMRCFRSVQVVPPHHDWHFAGGPRWGLRQCRGR